MSKLDPVPYCLQNQENRRYHVLQSHLSSDFPTTILFFHFSRPSYYTSPKKPSPFIFCISRISCRSSFSTLRYRSSVSLVLTFVQSVCTSKATKVSEDRPAGKGAILRERPSFWIVCSDMGTGDLLDYRGFRGIQTDDRIFCEGKERKRYWELLWERGEREGKVFWEKIRECQIRLYLYESSKAGSISYPTSS
jgi:hypothetical protein